MSSKPKKGKAVAKKQAEEKPVKPVRQEIKKPGGRVPRATVSSRHGFGIIARAGKGFSRGELTGASLTARLAGKWRVPTDFRRRSVLDPNVQALKKWFTAQPHKVETATPEPVMEEKPVKKRAVRKKKGVEQFRGPQPGRS